MPHSDYRSSLKKFSVLKNKLDHALFEYGVPFLLFQIIVTFLVFISADNPWGQHFTPRWFEVILIEFALIVLIVEVIVVRDFFNLIPLTFQELTERNVIRGLGKSEVVDEKLSTFLGSFEKALNNRMPIFLGGIFEIMILIANQRAYLFPIILMPEGFPISVMVLNFFTLTTPMMIVGYGMGVVIWKSLVTGYYVHRFSNTFELDIQPAHPDKAGGLKPIGDLVFSLALILIVASLSLSVFVAANSINDALYQYLKTVPSLDGKLLQPFFLYSTTGYSKLALAFLLALSLVAFFLPLMSAHRQMRAGKMDLLFSMTEIGNKIALLEKQNRNLKIGHKKRTEAFAEISSLSKVYEGIYKTPVWPFDRDILIKFFTPQFISLLSLLGVIQPVIDAVTSWMK